MGWEMKISDIIKGLKLIQDIEGDLTCLSIDDDHEPVHIGMQFGLVGGGEKVLIIANENLLSNEIDAEELI